MQDDTANANAPVAPGTGPKPPVVAIVVYDGLALFELAAANDVFGTDVTTASGQPLYQVLICGPAKSVMTEAGFRMEVPRGLDALDQAHTIVVLPTLFPERVPTEVLDALRRAGSRGQRLMSLCTGAFVLAAAGLLDGRAATTHWSECTDLARRYPRVAVDPDVLYVDEGELLTSAGSAASLDLCLHVLQRDYGTQVATRVARDLVIPLHRPGGQAQYIETPVPEPGGGGDLFARHAQLAPGAPRPGGDGRRPRRPGGDEPAHVRPAVPGQHRDHAADLDPARAGAAGATAPGDDRPAGRRDRGPDRFRHRRQPPQALRPDAAHHAAGLPAHVQGPGRVAYPCNCLTISSASLTCPLMLVIELKICRTVPSRSIT